MCTITFLRVVSGDVPDDWRGASLTLLAPVLDEVDPMIATLFTDGAVGAAAQGWLRATRAMAKMGVNRSRGMPSAW